MEEAMYWQLFAWSNVCQ